MKTFPEDPSKYNPVQLLNQLKPGTEFVDTPLSENPPCFYVQCVIDGIPFAGQSNIFVTLYYYCFTCWIYFYNTLHIFNCKYVSIFYIMQTQLQFLHLLCQIHSVRGWFSIDLIQLHSAIIIALFCLSIYIGTNSVHSYSIDIIFLSSILSWFSICNNCQSSSITFWNKNTDSISDLYH